MWRRPYIVTTFKGQTFLHLERESGGRERIPEGREEEGKERERTLGWEKGFVASSVSCVLSIAQPVLTGPPQTTFCSFAGYTSWFSFNEMLPKIKKRASSKSLLKISLNVTVIRGIS